MANMAIPDVDLVVLLPTPGTIPREVELGIRAQSDICIHHHYVYGTPQLGDRCRWETIARARNEGKSRGTAPWLMFLDADVVLAAGCISSLVRSLVRRPIYAALAADYRDERRDGQVANHVAMGATLFRRSALDEIVFRWSDSSCECQCCCDDLRRLRWAIDYCPTALARHLTKPDAAVNSPERHVEFAASAIGSRAALEQSESHCIPSVCLVTCYFGKLPGWIDHYLISCAYNPSINFLLFTDHPNLHEIPPNVRVERLNKSSFDKLASHAIGIDIRLSHPRKVCDFKPAFGHLFADYLSGFDYWGYSDVDVIFGDIRQFLSLARLHEHDLFTARKEFLVGHFTLCRNTPRINMLYQQSADLASTLQAREVRSFDECGGQCHQLLHGQPLDEFAACDSMTHIVRRLMADNKISAFFMPAVIESPELRPPGWRLRWDNGRLCEIPHGQEAMYFHFHAFKHQVGYRFPRPVCRDARFDMSPTGIESVNSQLGRELPDPTANFGGNPANAVAVD